MLRIFSLVFIALFACGCAVSGVDSPKSVKLKDFEPLIKEAISQEPINIEKLDIEDYNDKDLVAFSDMPQVKILELLKAYQKEHFRFNESLEKLAKSKSQKDFAKYYVIAQRNILLGALAYYYSNDDRPKMRISYDEFVNLLDSFFAEQGQFITDFGEYFFIALDEMDDESVCKEDSCGHATEVFDIIEIMASLKEQNKLNDRLESIVKYGRKGFNDYMRINSAHKALSLWGEKLNARNLLATKSSKKQIDDFVSEFDLEGAPTNLEKFMDYWISIYLGRLYMAKYGIEIALGEKVESVIAINPDICLYDIYLDKNAKKICEKEYIIQRMVARFTAQVATLKEKFYMIYDDKMCAIVDFGVLYDDKLFDSHIFKNPKIITNPNNNSTLCNAVKEVALSGGFKKTK